MKAYIVKNRSGQVAKGWLLRQGTSIDSAMCRLPGTQSVKDVEEVSIEAAVRGAGAEQPTLAQCTGARKEAPDTPFW